MVYLLSNRLSRDLSNPALFEMRALQVHYSYGAYLSWNLLFTAFRYHRFNDTTWILHL